MAKNGDDGVDEQAVVSLSRYVTSWPPRRGRVRKGGGGNVQKEYVRGFSGYCLCLISVFTRMRRAAPLFRLDECVCFHLFWYTMRKS